MVCFQFLIDYRHLLHAWKVKQTLYCINKDKLNKKLLKYLVLTVLSDLSAKSHLERTCTFLRGLNKKGTACNPWSEITQFLM